MFFKVTPIEEVLKILDGFPLLGSETVPLKDAYGRVLAQDFFATKELPEFFRSTMDGFAVNSRDTFGATGSIPSILEIVGEVPMGSMPQFELKTGECARIWTGGMLPSGADSVVMIEHSSMIDEKTIEVYRSVVPLENVIKPGDDFKKGEKVLEAGTVLMPQDIGALAAFGIAGVNVFKNPKIAIISTGDEIVPITEVPPPGKIRDVNSYSLCSFARKYNAEPILLGICRDEESEFRDKLLEARELGDSIWISGGSSVGMRDITIKVLESFKDVEILIHGISISPGKPTIIARTSDGRGIFGLPGHITSAMVVAEILLSYFLLRITGQSPDYDGIHHRIQAEITRNVDSSGGRDDYIRVKIIKEGDRLFAEPIFGKSGLISTLVQGDGLVRIERNREGLYKGEKVNVILLRDIFHKKGV